MEQQNQTRTARTEQRRDRGTPERRSRRAEQRGLSQAGLLAQAVLAGTSLLDAPPQDLEELAGRVGNTAMQALLAAQTPQPEEVFFSLPAGEPDTVPIQVPSIEPALVLPDTPAAGGAQGGAADYGSAV